MYSTPIALAHTYERIDMSSEYPLRELNSPSVGWAQISLDFGRDEAFCEIEDESLILAAAGLMVAGLTACLSKDENWLSRKEVLRAVIPGTHESKLAAAEALCAEDYRTVFRRRAAKIGRPELTPHSCRDTFASLSVSAGVPITSIAQSLGHADPSITLRVYSSFYDSDFDKLRELLGEEVSKAKKGPKGKKRASVTAPT